MAAIYVTTGCAQNNVAQNKGSYTRARHMSTGSNIPVPDRADAGNVTASQMDQEQFQHLQSQATTGGGGAH